MVYKQAAGGKRACVGLLKVNKDGAHLDRHDRVGTSVQLLHGRGACSVITSNHDSKISNLHRM